MQQAARAMSSTVFGFLSLFQLPRNSSVPPCTSIESERLFAWSNNKDEKIRANHRESGNVFFNEKESAAYGTKLIISLTYLEIPVPTFTKDLFKKTTTPFISMLLKLLFKMLTHTQEGVPAPSAQRGKHLIN